MINHPLIKIYRSFSFFWCLIFLTTGADDRFREVLWLVRQRMMCFEWRCLKKDGVSISSWRMSMVKAVCHDRTFLLSLFLLLNERECSTRPSENSTGFLCYFLVAILVFTFCSTFTASLKLVSFALSPSLCVCVCVCTCVPSIVAR